MIKTLALLLALTTAALAQSGSPTKQSGNVTPTHVACWTTNGIIQDCGTAAIPYLTTIGTVGQGPTICANSGPTTSAFVRLCLAANTNSSAVISVQNFGGASPQTLTFDINGTSYSFPFIVGGIVGPVSSVVNDVACWNNITGTLLQDCGTFPNATPGGSSGNVQYNAGGAFGGYTNPQLTALINLATASLSGAVPAWPNNTTTFFRGDGTWSGLPSTIFGGQSVAPGGTAAVQGNGPKIQLSTGSTTTGDCVEFNINGNTVDSGAGCSGGLVVANVVNYGADNTCTSDSTAAFQSAWNTAAAAGGQGIVYIPPVTTTGCYKVSKLNGVNASGVIVMGGGGKSLITITGADANGNWWDLSGSRNITFRDININSTSNVSIAFLWACTGTSCATSGVLAGLNFYNVNVAIGTTTAILYGYGYGPVAGARANANNGGGAFSINDSTWTQLHNGTATCTYASPNTCNSILHLTALNDLTVTSANGVTIGTGAAVAWRTVLKNFDMVDYPSGFGNGTQDNNAAIVLYNAAQLTMIGGSVQCVCVPDEVVWSNTEGITHIQTAFEASDGSANTTKWWVLMGGGTNAVLDYQSVLFSAATGGYIAIGPGTASNTGGVQYLTVSTPDVGLNSNNAAFITTIDGSGGATACGSFVSSNNWIVRSHIEFTQGTGSSEIVGCGGIDSQTFLQGIGTNIFLASGSTDHGTSNPFR